MTNSDLGRLLRSDEVQRVLRTKTHDRKRRLIKRNPLKNNRTLARLNPYALVQKRNALRTHLKLANVRRAPSTKTAAGKAAQKK